MPPVLDIIRDRLELNGYTLETSIIAFENWINKEISTYERYIKGKDGEVFIEHLESLKMINPITWMSTLQKIYGMGLSNRRTSNQTGEHNGTLLGYMLKDQQGWYGYPGWDLNVAIRLAIEALPTTEELVYDLTDLVLSGDY
jgi:hypothetical protein